MKEIKLIDLFDLIARGEEVPKKIKVDDEIFNWNGCDYIVELDRDYGGYGLEYWERHRHDNLFARLGLFWQVGDLIYDEYCVEILDSIKGE